MNDPDPFMAGRYWTARDVDPVSGVQIDQHDIEHVALGDHEILPINEYHRDQHRRIMQAFQGKRYVARGECARCQCERWGIWVELRKSNGSRIATLRCIVCISKLRECGAAKIAEHLPLWQDNTTDMPPCERCGLTDGVELHHWAPRYLFTDADEWPMSYLCRGCHMAWHRIVTPDMGRKTAS